jgi:hypothetical protein
LRAVGRRRATTRAGDERNRRSDRDDTSEAHHPRNDTRQSIRRIDAPIATRKLSNAQSTIGRMRSADRATPEAMTQLRLADQTWAASRRMIARGERPGYRIADTGDGETIHVIELPWLGRVAADRAKAIRRARQAIAAWLDVDPETFDVERE